MDEEIMDEVASFSRRMRGPVKRRVGRRVIDDTRGSACWHLIVNADSDHTLQIQCESLWQIAE
jgi:hypothetical protein